MKLYVVTAKEAEVHTDTIRVFQDKRIYYSSGGQIIKSGSLCKVRESITGESVYAILRGIEKESEKDTIKIDESLRKSLGVNIGESHEFTFHKTCFLERIYWMCSTTDYGYRISAQVAVLSFLVSIVFSILLYIIS